VTQHHDAEPDRRPVPATPPRDTVAAILERCANEPSWRKRRASWLLIRALLRQRRQEED
jgi:hypothetical protein